MPDRRSIIKLALGAGLTGSVPAAAATLRRHAPENVAANLALGRALLAEGDDAFRARARELAQSAHGYIADLATDAQWQAAVRDDFEAGRVRCTAGFAFAETEALLLAALAQSLDTNG